VRDDDSASDCGGAQQLFLPEVPARTPFGEAANSTRTGAKRLSGLGASKKRLKWRRGLIAAWWNQQQKSSWVEVEE
jgi:hypothetical protein